MRVALIADIHGNPIAFDAVLDAVGVVDEYWLLGDFVALGPDPLGVLDRIDALPKARCIRGNTDRYTVTGDRPSPSKEEALADPALLDTWKEIQASFSWTQGAVAAAGRIDWLDSLPLEIRSTFPDGTRLLGVHASPGRDDGDGAVPLHTDHDLASRFSDADADLVVVGHTHRVVDRIVGDVHIVNPGCVSNPLDGPDDARFAILEADGSGYQVQLRSAPYDRAAVIDLLERVRHPARAFIGSHFET